MVLADYFTENSGLIPVRIASQTSGTPGGAGVYTTTGTSQTISTGGNFWAMYSYQSSLAISGNHLLTTGAAFGENVPNWWQMANTNP